MENKNQVNNNQGYENNKSIRIIVGFISITITLAMIYYTARTIFNVKHQKMKNIKNPIKIEQIDDSEMNEKELVKSR